MTDTQALPLAFLTRNPAGAAAVLDDLPAADAAAFLAGVPPRIGGAVLARMLPWPASRCIAALPADHAAATLREAPFQDAAAILRLLTEAETGPALDALPKRLAADFRRSLTYPEGTVGAWIDPGLAMLHVDESVAAARKAARKSHRLSDVLFLIDGNRKLAGAVRAAALLRLDDSAPLLTAAEAAPDPLPARMRIATALDAADWDRFSVLPVVSRKNQVIGALPRAVLVQATSGLEAGHQDLAGANLSGHLFSAYGATMFELLNMTAAGAMVRTRSKSSRSRRR